MKVIELDRVITRAPSEPVVSTPRAIAYAPTEAVTAPSPRIRVVRQAQKTIAYFGFEQQSGAQLFFAWMVGKNGKYNHRTQRGACPPRPATRVDGCNFEVEVYEPDMAVLSICIEKDLEIAASRMLTTSEPSPEPPLTRTQGIYQISSQGRQYFRYVVTLGHEVEISIHIRGGQITNSKAIGRADQVRRWIRQGLSPETIVPMIRQWR